MALVLPGNMPMLYMNLRTYYLIVIIIMQLILALYCVLTVLLVFCYAQDPHDYDLN